MHRIEEFVVLVGKLDFFSRSTYLSFTTNLHPLPVAVLFRYPIFCTTVQLWAYKGLDKLALLVSVEEGEEEEEKCKQIR